MASNNIEAIDIGTRPRSYFGRDALSSLLNTDPTYAGLLSAIAPEGASKFGSSDNRTSLASEYGNALANNLMADVYGTTPEGVSQNRIYGSQEEATAAARKMLEGRSAQDLQDRAKSSFNDYYTQGDRDTSFFGMPVNTVAALALMPSLYALGGAAFGGEAAGAEAGGTLAGDGFTLDAGLLGGEGATSMVPTASQTLAAGAGDMTAALGEVAIPGGGTLASAANSPYVNAYENVQAQNSASQFAKEKSWANGTDTLTNAKRVTDGLKMMAGSTAQPQDNTGMLDSGSGRQFGLLDVNYGFKPHLMGLLGGGYAG